MGKKDIRLNEIIKMLKFHKRVELSKLAEAFNVSEMTIRRDLEDLKASNLISNIHGTIVYNEEFVIDDDSNHYFVFQQKGIKDDEKERIAKEASKYVEPGDSIIVDIGTTTSKIVKFIPNNYPITLICFTANTLVDAVKKNFDRLFLGGGYYHPSSQMFESTEIDTYLKDLRASKVFVSAAGISDTLGITCINQYEVETKKSSLNHSNIKILLADSSKFGKVRNGYFAELSDMDIIISDTNLSTEWIEIIKKHNIELKLV